VNDQQRLGPLKASKEKAFACVAEGGGETCASLAICWSKHHFQRLQHTHDTSYTTTGKEQLASSPLPPDCLRGILISYKAPPPPTCTPEGHVMPSAIPPSTATAVASAAITAGRKGRLAQVFGKMTVACPAQVQREDGEQEGRFGRSTRNSRISFDKLTGVHTLYHHTIDPCVWRMYLGQARSRSTRGRTWGMRG